MTFRLRSAARQISRAVLKGVAQQIARRWEPYSRLFLVSDVPFWSVAWDMKELAAIARKLGVRVVQDPRWMSVARDQAIFFGSHTNFLAKDWTDRPHRLATAYFHGFPRTGYEEFDQMYDRLCQVHPHIHRIQVTNEQMRGVVLSTGIDPQKVFLIRIGINLDFFEPQTPRTRDETRARYGIPRSAVVIGSFQKDGLGLGEGLEPKHVKGPDVFLKFVDMLRGRVPELYILLAGLARGYVRRGLEQMGVPHQWLFLKDYRDIGRLYHALDAYVVPSRQEGGPKAVLEAMATGVPLITTRVGQAAEIVEHGVNGWMVDVEDAEGLAYWTERALAQRSAIGPILHRGRQTAEAHTYQSLIPRWREFMRGFVALDGD